MLIQVGFKRDFRCFRATDQIGFGFSRNMVPIVGDQGCGKSTLIELIRCVASSPEMKQRQWRSMGIRDAGDIITLAVQPACRFMGYDFERDTGRTAPDLQFHALAEQLHDMRSSHGQASMSWLRGLVPTAKALREKAPPGSDETPFVVLLDEPDANLSPRSCYEVVRIFRELIVMSCQIVASLHNPILMHGTIPDDPTPGWSNVYSMEHRRWMSADAFLATQAVVPDAPPPEPAPVKTTKVRAARSKS